MSTSIDRNTAVPEESVDTTAVHLELSKKLDTIGGPNARLILGQIDAGR